MTESEKLDLLKGMIGQSGDSENLSDEVLTSYLKVAGQKIINRAYPYNQTIIKVPDKYCPLQCDIAKYLLNKRGADGETSHSENGISRTYESGDVPESMLSEVTPYCGVL